MLTAEWFSPEYHNSR